MTSKRVEIKPAATVLLIRDPEHSDDAKPEIFMVVRHHEIDFASGALVFPGGKVDPGDETDELADFVPDTDDPLLSFKIASIRESFEEAGVFLARDKVSGDLVSGDRLVQLENKYRKALQGGSIDILRVVELENLELATDLLVHYSHWITPIHMPKRFDTHFFIARAPDNQLAIHDGEESVDSVWISAEDALQGARDGTYTVVFPTRMNIELLIGCSSVSDALTKSGARNVVTIEPILENTEEGNFLNIPAGAGHSVTRFRR